MMIYLNLLFCWKISLAFSVAFLYKALFSQLNLVESLTRPTAVRSVNWSEEISQPVTLNTGVKQKHWRVSGAEFLGKIPKITKEFNWSHCFFLFKILIICKSKTMHDKLYYSMLQCQWTLWDFAKLSSIQLSWDGLYYQIPTTHPTTHSPGESK